MVRHYPEHVRATTPDLIELARRPELDRMPDEGPLLVAPDRLNYVREPKPVAAPLPPVMCEVDFDTPLLEQFEALQRAGFLDFSYLSEEGIGLLRNLPRPERSGKLTVELSQQTFGKGATTYGDIGKTPVPDGRMFKDPHHFAGYLGRNKTVGLAYDFACAVPCTSGDIWLMIQRTGMKRPLRALTIRRSHMRALTSSHYLVGR